MATGNSLEKMSGGVINIVTKDPTDVASTDIYVQLGSNNERNFTAAFNGPVLVMLLEDSQFSISSVMDLSQMNKKLDSSEKS